MMLARWRLNSGCHSANTVLIITRVGRGSTISSHSPPGTTRRSAVVQYTNLYTNETFSPLNPDASLQAIELSALGAKVGASLTPENIALP
jgi:hypothetical protein